MSQDAMVHRSFKVALDPTPAQERMFASHAGGARFAYNWGIARIAQALQAREDEKAATGEATTEIPNHFALCKQWTQWKDSAEWTDRDTGQTVTGVPWVANNFSGTYQAALQHADRAWKSYFDSRTGQRKGKALGRPRFKSKHKSRQSAQFHGATVGLVSATRVKLPRVGTVKVMSDDSHHSAMVRSRKRTPGQRHMGNRRRSRVLWQQLRQGSILAAQAADLLGHLADSAPDQDHVLATLNHLADERARASAVATATERLTKAVAAADKAAQEAHKRAATGTQTAADKAAAQATKAQERVTKAKEALRRAEAITADRKSAWTPRKLADVCRTGALTPEQADLLAQAFDATAQQTDLLAQAAQQPRIIRAVASRGADGLWWLSLSAEVPARAADRSKSGPTRRQRERGAVGLDLGVRQIGTLSKRLGGDRNLHNPRYLEQALDELGQAQRNLSRRVPGSKRHAVAKSRVGLIHADVARLREQHHHRVSTRLARTFSAVAVEGFNLQDMAQRGDDDTGKLPRRVRRRRNRALADSSLGALRGQLAYKTSRYGSHLTVVDSSLPTGRTCASCGAVKAKPVPPSTSVFSCDACGRSVPRRLNTARFLEQATAGESSSPSGGLAESRGEGVGPLGLRPEGQSSAKRAARSRSPDRGQTGTPDP